MNNIVPLPFKIPGSLLKKPSFQGCIILYEFGDNKRTSGKRFGDIWTSDVDVVEQGHLNHISIGTAAQIGRNIHDPTRDFPVPFATFWFRPVVPNPTHSQFPFLTEIENLGRDIDTALTGDVDMEIGYVSYFQQTEKCFVCRS
jgi:hypothetical protein